MLEFSFLTDEFYEDYKACTEIEKKNTRPYIRIEVEIDGVLFGIPLRSHITHPHALWTDKANKCGADFSKAVVITNPTRHINIKDKPYIRPNEFNALRGKEYQIKVGMEKYIAEYEKAKKNSKIPRNRQLLMCSTLQYFEKYI